MTSDPRTPTERRVVLVVGAGRSGTSTLAGLLRLLGLHVPRPEVAADDSNPRGFAEPQWVVDRHDRLLRAATVQVADARPAAWDACEAVADAAEGDAVRAWLAGQLDAHPRLVVKDPRLAWFLPLWREACAAAGAGPAFATMLRPPAEVVGSRETYYGSRLGHAHLVASWLNVLLHTERATRGADRAFVRYGDLLGDWRAATAAAGAALGLPEVEHPDDERLGAASGFVDPGLRRMSHTLDDLTLPARLRDLAGATWEQLDRLVDPARDTPEAHAALDELWAGYVDLYEESEAVSRSSVVAAEHLARGSAPAPAPAPHAADRVPHRLRALVPASLRRRLRAAAGRPR